MSWTDDVGSSFKRRGKAMIQDVSDYSAFKYDAKPSGVVVHEKYRPMRGQAYVLMQHIETSPLIIHRGNPRDEKSHRGKVVALGPAARLTEHPDSPIIPWGIEVGDDVHFVLAVWLDKMRVLEMLGVTGDVAVVSQAEILAVWS